MRLLIIGNGPLPEENVRSRPAAGLRTDHFYKGLKRGLAKSEKDVELRLVKIAMPECYENADFGDDYTVSKDDPALKSKIQKMHDQFQPDAIVAINTFPSSLACQLKTKAAIWCDLNGWIMAEAQAQAYKLGSDDLFGHYYALEEQVLSRADKISTVSEAQKYAVYGELARIGRVNRANFGYRMVETVANATEDFANEHGDERLSKVPEDGVKVLWLGGYNTWVDEETLFKGVEEAMRVRPNLWFISTGGEIDGLDNKTFKKFREMVDLSEFKERFLFLGWLNTNEIPYLLRSVDVGLNVDRDCLETWTGARNRINEMMKFRLPVVTTLGSEISYEVLRVGAGVAVNSGDFQGLARGIEAAIAGRMEMGAAGRLYIEEEANYEATLSALFKWIENGAPKSARGRVKGGMLRAGWRYLRQNGAKKFWAKLRQRF